MVTKAKKDVKEQKKGRVKVDLLKLNKETVRDLTAGEVKKIRGGTGRTDANLYYKELKIQ